MLIGNSPYLDRLPVYLTCHAAGVLPEAEEANRIVDRYNAAIGRVVGAHGAKLVELRAAGLAARRSGTEPALIARDGFHPSTSGHRALAAAFTSALVG